MRFLGLLLFISCLLGVALGVGVDVDHCTPQGTLYRMDRENSCNDCCCTKTDGKVDYIPKCTPKAGCQVPTPIDWTKMKKVFLSKYC